MVVDFIGTARDCNAIAGNLGGIEGENLIQLRPPKPLRICLGAMQSQAFLRLNSRCQFKQAGCGRPRTPTFIVLTHRLHSVPTCTIMASPADL
ncbi:hypothetical protein K227x_46570 [Rubripirellula lacrimiformis]|uniref:Uncharacterized protein n=1 Tax=Rubripirellula lacrimiformis TaxID=1930273 RepID=A0A517NGN9_9BACT|nr:hypothetical protein K227x_46570 [Rubripirellula lacrimiformis]